jgi:gliding motility-associated-like protein
VAVSLSQVETGPASTRLNLTEGGGYIVRSASGKSAHYVYVVNWVPVHYASIQFLSEGDPCQEVRLKVTAEGEDMAYYTASGLKRALSRTHTLSWNSLDWNAGQQAYQKVTLTSTSSNLAYNWSVSAPLCDTYFTVSGDQFARWFGQEESFVSALYQAVAVKQQAKAVVQLRESSNETGASTGDLSGSAPLEVRFYSHPSEAVKLVEWYIYKPGAETQHLRYTDEELNYTFKESGKYRVKLYVSNSTCRDSAEFNPTLSESMLDCPNFFTPRSSPGENDEFKVVYRSIVTFKGVIMNRWGNVLFTWTDPDKGWDGTYQGKAVKPGVYFYLIEAVGADGIVYKKKGAINLLE